jgi:hypothetical protein
VASVYRSVLMGRAREFVKEQCVLEPAEFRIARIVGEQRVRAREHIFRRVAALVPSGLAGTLEDLLVVKPDENSSGLQEPSVDAMLTLLDKLKLIEARCVLGVDLSWLNANHQRALFHRVTFDKCRCFAFGPCYSPNEGARGAYYQRTL